jgi:regulator of CtrA degradation
MGITFGKFGSRASASVQGSTVSFGEHFASSEQFDAIFKQGMALVERTASYLDGTGRKEAKALKAPLTLVYATESMRLTTRLLELASWLLIRRAVKDGEISAEEAALKRERVKLQPLGRPSHVKGYAELPAGLRDLIDASFSLNDRIVQLDRALTTQHEPDGTPAKANPVDSQVQRLQAAFAQRH